MMKLKIRLMVVPALLTAGLLGACGPENGTGGAGVSTPSAPESGVVQGAETPVVGQDQAEAVNTPNTASEDQAGAVTTPNTASEDQAGAATTPNASEEQAGAATTPNASEEQAGAATTPNASQEQAGAATTPNASQEQAGAATTPNAATESQANAAATPEMGQFDMMSAYKASEIIGANVQNPQGDDLGEIKDVVVDLNNSQAKYAVLSFGGFFNIGDKLFAIPVSAMDFNATDHVFVLDADKDKLESAPNFDANNWPDVGTPDWGRDADVFWANGMGDTTGNTTQDQSVAQSGTPTTQDQTVAQNGTPTTQDQTVAQSQDSNMTDQPMAVSLARASELMDYEIYNSQGDETGHVEDLIIQMDPQHMAYAVLSLDNAADNSAVQGDTAQSDTTTQDTTTQDTTAQGDTTTQDTTTQDATVQGDTTIQDNSLAQGDRLYAVPLSNLHLDTQHEDAFVFNADPQTLDTALSFSQDEWSNEMNLDVQ